MQYFDYEVARWEYERAASALNSADKQRSEASRESRSILKDYSDKIVLYSVGSFSFLVTLLQLVKNTKILAEPNLFGIPNVFYMYISMGFYIISVVLALISKRFDAYYVSYQSMQNYCEKLIEEREKKLKIFEIYPERVLSNNEPEVGKENMRKDIDLVKPKLLKNKTKAKFWYNLMVLSGDTAQWFAVFATIFMYLFTVQLAQNLVW